ncbi:unnamed protein product, partial [Amoebophrya sp. A120]
IISTSQHNVTSQIQHLQQFSLSEKIPTSIVSCCIRLREETVCYTESVLLIRLHKRSSQYS